MMFEKAKPSLARAATPSGDHSAEQRMRLRAAAAISDAGRGAEHPVRRAGDALRAVEWSELTARLNAARDLRLLLRSEARAPIAAVAASFGDAAASYFALVEDGEPDVNHDALGQLKGPGAMVVASDGSCSGATRSPRSDAPCGVARGKQ
jgi:hypothetical protein